MRRFTSLLAIMIGLGVTDDAHAWIIIIPGALKQALADAFTGARGNICVKEGTQAGQVIESPNGNNAKVLSVSGTSGMCRNPATPIRAELEFTNNFTSKAGIDMPDEYQPTEITDLERFNGILMKAASKTTKNQGVTISSAVRKPDSNIEAAVARYETNMLSNKGFKEVSSKGVTKVDVNGMKAVRVEVDATLGGFFGQKVTYLYTILEGESELVVVNAYAPAEVLAARRTDVVKLSESITGLRAAVAAAPAVAPASAAAAASAPGGPPAAEATTALPPLAAATPAASASGAASAPAAAAPASAAAN